MNNSPLTSKPDNSKLIYGSEVLLFIFAAFLLIAAIPPKTIDANAVPVKVNMPMPTNETLNTASVQISADDQTTALLTIEVLPQIKATQ